MYPRLSTQCMTYTFPPLVSMVYADCVILYHGVTLLPSHCPTYVRQDLANYGQQVKFGLGKHDPPIYLLKV